jgi:hypothetical protein
MKWFVTVESLVSSFLQSREWANYGLSRGSHIFEKSNNNQIVSSCCFFYYWFLWAKPLVG